MIRNYLDEREKNNLLQMVKTKLINFKIISNMNKHKFTQFVLEHYDISVQTIQSFYKPSHKITF